MKIEVKIKVVGEERATDDAGPQRTLSVLVPSNDARDLIRRHYHNRILRAARDHGIADVRYIVDPEA